MRDGADGAGECAGVRGLQKQLSVILKQARKFQVMSWGAKMITPTHERNMRKLIFIAAMLASTPALAQIPGYHRLRDLGGGASIIVEDPCDTAKLEDDFQKDVCLKSLENLTPKAATERDLFSVCNSSNRGYDEKTCDKITALKKEYWDSEKVEIEKHRIEAELAKCNDKPTSIGVIMCRWTVK
jgi:hypothetical protein